MNPKEAGDLAVTAQHFTANSKKAKDAEGMIRGMLHAFLSGKHSESGHLGDRKMYIGSSDHCERAAYLDRIKTREFSLETLMRFERGRYFEDLMAAALEKKGIMFSREAELIHPEKPYVKSHIDFLFEREDSDCVTVGIMECKDTDGIPGAPYETWKSQVTQQTGMAILNYQRKSTKPVVIKSVLVAKDAASCDIGVFNKFQFTWGEFNKIMDGTDRIWAVLKGDESLDTLISRSDILCAYCEHRFDCPAFFRDGNIDLTPISNIVTAYLFDRDTAKKAESSKKRNGRIIKEFMGDRKLGICNAGHVKMVRVKAIQETDSQGLEEFLREFAPDILAQFTRKKEGYSYPRITSLLTN